MFQLIEMGSLNSKINLNILITPSVVTSEGEAIQASNM